MATKKDFSQVAFAVVEQATGALPKPKPLTAKQLAGAKGGLKGGKARMEKLTDEQRSALAMKGVAGRKKTPTGEVGARLVRR